MKLKICIIIIHSLLLGFPSNSIGQLFQYGSCRAISLNELKFEKKGNILGEFYITPVVDKYVREGDSIRLEGSILFMDKPLTNVMVFICKKSKQNLCQRLNRVMLYEIKYFCCPTDVNGKFNIKIHFRNEIILFRDYKLKQDQFLFINYE